MSDQTTDDSAREREIRSHYGGLIDTSYRLYRQSAVALSVTAISFSTAVLGWSVLKVIPLLGDSAWLGSYMLAFTGAILFAFVFQLFHFLGNKYEAHSRYYGEGRRWVSETHPDEDIQPDLVDALKRGRDTQKKKADRCFGIIADKAAVVSVVLLIVGIVIGTVTIMESGILHTVPAIVPQNPPALP